MSCNIFRLQIETWLDGELASEEAASLSKHLGSCADCRKFRDVAKGMRELLRGAAVAPVPAGFEARFFERMEKRAGAPAGILPAWAAEWRVPTPLEMAAVLCVALLVGGLAGAAMSIRQEKNGRGYPVSPSEWGGLSASAFPTIYEGLMRGGNIR